MTNQEGQPVPPTKEGTEDHHQLLLMDLEITVVQYLDPNKPFHDLPIDVRMALRVAVELVAAWRGWGEKQESTTCRDLTLEGQRCLEWTNRYGRKWIQEPVKIEPF